MNMQSKGDVSKVKCYANTLSVRVFGRALLRIHYLPHMYAFDVNAKNNSIGP